MKAGRFDRPVFIIGQSGRFSQATHVEKASLGPPSGGVAHGWFMLANPEGYLSSRHRRDRFEQCEIEALEIVIGRFRLGREFGDHRLS